MAQKKKATAASRAWSVLRLALLWARKGGVFRRWRLMLGLRVALKSLRAGGSGARVERVRYMERELSFDETPTFSFKMSRPASLRFPRIPCIRTPSANLGDDEEEDWICCRGEREHKFFQGQEHDDDHDHDHEDESDSEESEGEGEGIDSKAEEFISNFYEHLKLQRQVSLIQYNEMLQRGVN